MALPLLVSRVPALRPRGWPEALLVVLAAVLLGVATGLATYPTLVALAAVLSVVVLLPRVDLAALAVVTTAVADDALDRLVPGATEWLMVVLVLAWLVRRAAGRLHPGRTGALLLPAGVFAAVVLLAAVAHPQGAAGLAVVARYALLLAVFAVLVDVLAGPLAPRRAARAYVASCVVAAAVGLVSVVAGAEHRASGLLSRPDDLGFFLVAALPLVATLGLSRRVVLPAVAVLVGGVLATHSHGAWIALGVVLAVAAATRLLSLRHTGLALALVGSAAALVLAVLPQAVGSTLSEQQQDAETRLSQRVDLWSAAAAMTRAHPALGLGPGAFGLYHEDFRDDAGAGDDLVGRDLDDAHSTVLQASAELGVLGAATLLGVFLAPVVAARRRWRRDRLLAGAALALTGLVVAALLETEQERLPLWFLAALTAVLARPAPRPVTPGPGTGERTLGLPRPARS